MNEKVKVAIIAGSKSDKEIANSSAKMLEEFNVSYEVKFISAHRQREKLEEYVKNSSADVFIAIAGLAAHLPGAIASVTSKPVIGVPVSVKLNGLDALLSIVQMPSGIPVAAVGIDNGKNAAILAAEIIALSDEEVKKRLEEYRRRLRNEHV
jgi:5-(carboxyamino)imidazole ribonucleotide mutase